MELDVAIDEVVEEVVEDAVLVEEVVVLLVMGKGAEEVGIPVLEVVLTEVELVGRIDVVLVDVDVGRVDVVLVNVDVGRVDVVFVNDVGRVDVELDGTVDVELAELVQVHVKE